MDIATLKRWARMRARLRKAYEADPQAFERVISEITAGDWKGTIPASLPPFEKKINRRSKVPRQVLANLLAVYQRFHARGGKYEEFLWRVAKHAGLNFGAYHAFQIQSRGAAADLLGKARALAVNDPSFAAEVAELEEMFRRRDADANGV
jgi:hypothetical protein